ncbi:skin secretory protein xP2-like [Panicum virgatum]|uniref:skin secretory protein xP2-like n=1 Tax=Panicum virgatum TaxID=38727 RepID=UPI0019D54013|nr:skin secretory protein xP2-like [Panicum virgatum]
MARRALGARRCSRRPCRHRPLDAGQPQAAAATDPPVGGADPHAGGADTACAAAAAQGAAATFLLSLRAAPLPAASATDDSAAAPTRGSLVDPVQLRPPPLRVSPSQPASNPAVTAPPPLPRGSAPWALSPPRGRAPSPGPPPPRGAAQAPALLLP